MQLDDCMNIYLLALNYAKSQLQLIIILCINVYFIHLAMCQQFFQHGINANKASHCVKMRLVSILLLFCAFLLDVYSNYYASKWGVMLWKLILLKGKIAVGVLKSVYNLNFNLNVRNFEVKFESILKIVKFLKFRSWLMRKIKKHL